MPTVPEYARPGDRDLARRELAWELRVVRGMKFRDVAAGIQAEGLGPCSYAEALNLVDAVYQRTDALLAEQAARDRLMQATRYEWIYTQAIQAFLASKDGVRLARQREVELPDDAPPPPGAGPAVAAHLRRLLVMRKEQHQEVRQSHGDGRFLMIALQALAQRARLLGSADPAVVAADPAERALERERAERLAKIRALAPEELDQLAAIGRRLGLARPAEF